ncbi:hypothetical protein P7C70_g3464, partial [Phenoliferia sp. Uapishka_3]
MDDFDSDDERAMEALLQKKKAAAKKDENQNPHGTPAPKRKSHSQAPTTSSSAAKSSKHSKKKVKRAPLIPSSKKRGACSEKLVADEVCSGEDRLSMIREVHLACGIQRIDRTKNWDDLPDKVRKAVRLHVTDACQWLDKMDGPWVIDKAARAYLTNHHKAIRLKNLKMRKARNTARKERRSLSTNSDPDVSDDSDMQASFSSKKKGGSPTSSETSGSDDDDGSNWCAEWSLSGTGCSLNDPLTHTERKIIPTALTLPSTASLSAQSSITQANTLTKSLFSQQVSGNKLWVCLRSLSPTL